VQTVPSPSYSRRKTQSLKQTNERERKKRRSERDEKTE
jgi:hypothetical protein